ncbi:hypothetical protein EDD29_7284 [Actinocorallia herbida]|uniref:HTH cro/C1-type domain-containing protein n=1 Tax=Actinocorallia herbida TaxID=58109 RepID=A0A3N1D7U2_9ACTN|nr:XRE family transcriptional regulator [Actinocorallia herbida]ROO89585.1 hypothetical protein EDD29_7284 [Actinocorallia herbida]
MSDSLRQAIAQSRLTERDIAVELDVDPKTVRRWLDGRLPYPRHRVGLAEILGVDERELWPELANGQASPPGGDAEILATYPHRWAVPRDVWYRLFASAQRDIGVLVYSGLFLAEDAGIVRALRERAAAGASVRILLGDPDSPEVTERGEAEGVGDAVSAKIRNALACYRPLRGADGIEVRLHRTVLYSSIYRGDAEMLVNPHIFGIAAARAPVLHLRQTSAGDMMPTYLESFERTWESAQRTLL